MTITFITNFINHQQTPLADEIYKLIGNNYAFVATMDVPQWIKDSGYPDLSDRTYLIKAYEDKDQREKAMKLAFDSDIVIIGSAPDDFIIERLKYDKITFRYSERIFKKGYRSLFSPRVWWYLYKSHIRYRGKRMFMLCASAYTAFDTSLFFSYPGKCYKWGYFTKFEDIDLDKIIQEKHNTRVNIFWVARFLDWKHPELPVKLAKELKDKGYDFHINMAGRGVLFEQTKRLIHDLGVEDFVSLIGNHPNEEINKMMRQSHIYLMTSDKGEGWATVVNEAMSNGCTVVGSHSVGSIPYLIENGKNGLVFRSGNLESLTRQVQTLIDDRPLCERLARNAYQTMKNVWNPNNAAKRFLELSSSLINGTTAKFSDGPCSKAL